MAKNWISKLPPNIKLKLLIIKNYFFRSQNQLNFFYITQLQYCQKYQPSNFSYEMGRTWATVQIASQDFFVQTGGCAPHFVFGIIL